MQRMRPGKNAKNKEPEDHPTCQKYKLDREILFQKIDALCDNFKNLKDEEKFIYLLTAGNDIASLVGKFTETHLP